MPFSVKTKEMLLVCNICTRTEPVNRSWNRKRIDLPESKTLNRQRVFLFAISTSTVHNSLHGLVELLFRDTGAGFFSRFVTSVSFNKKNILISTECFPLVPDSLISDTYKASAIASASASLMLWISACFFSWTAAASSDSDDLVYHVRSRPFCHRPTGARSELPR